MLPETRKRFLRLARATGMARGAVLAALDEVDDARLASELVYRHGARRDIVLQILGEIFRVPAVDVTCAEMDTGLLKMAAGEFWLRAASVPLREEDGQLLVAMADPEDLPVVDEVTVAVARPIRVCVGLARDILQHVEDWGGGLKLEDLVTDLARELDAAGEGRLKSTTKSEAKSPAVWLLDTILAEAVERGIDEVYFIPFPDGEAHVRFKLHDKIVERKTYPMHLHKKVVGRLRVLADLVGKATREPQQGVYLVELLERLLRVEVMIVPAAAGGDAVTVFLHEQRPARRGGGRSG